jgi:hypothetical protein
MYSLYTVHIQLDLNQDNIPMQKSDQNTLNTLLFANSPTQKPSMIALGIKHGFFHPSIIFIVSTFGDRNYYLYPPLCV